MVGKLGGPCCMVAVAAGGVPITWQLARHCCASRPPRAASAAINGEMATKYAAEISASLAGRCVMQMLSQGATSVPRNGFVFFRSPGQRLRGWPVSSEADFQPGRDRVLGVRQH